MKFLIIDDDAEIAEVLRISLAFQWRGAEVLWAAEGQAGIEMAKSERPDLVLLDLLLPGVSGFEVCEKIRKTSQVPIIVLSVKHSEADKVRALQAGADDYVTKPFGHLELQARMQAVFRRTGSYPEAPAYRFECGDMVVDTAEHKVCIGEHPVHLTLIEFTILSILLANYGFPVPYKTLQQGLVPYAPSTEKRLLKTPICHLRKKLCPPGHPQPEIIAIRGIGYKFLCPGGKPAQQIAVWHRHGRSFAGDVASSPASPEPP